MHPSSSFKALPSTSPPAYSERDPASAYPSPSPPPPPSRLPVPTAQTSPFAGSSSGRPPNHRLFGPTPITTQPLVPYAYYDARSPYSLAQADARARRRFFGSLAWALVAWIAIGILIGASDIGEDEGIFGRTWTRISPSNAWWGKERGDLADSV
ncbi:hypothetical protein Hypma_012846 [Hypsizygus marmoreus]|uniref:Uncharacterized protein n=1 Tax=Hypsizygus marmoreus TaxID=39966 RepID=A0A369JJV4_HYPMA|nr:hypothetical protein Hypma_012846 [Hypsizygus marmoreus]